MNNKTRRLFLLDGLGALTTAALLFFLLAEFEYFFGVPKNVLNMLSLTALLFSGYSFGCFLWIKQHGKFFLSLIAVANVLYCLLTSGLLLYHYTLLTQWGIAYFVGEIAVILVLAYVEFKTVMNL